MLDKRIGGDYMTLEADWFTEFYTECGSAFSLKVIEKLHEEQTPFQNIAIYKTEKFGNLMTIDGFIMLTDRDNFIYHEMMSHPVLFTHKDPKSVVIIGGGDCGTLKEVLKHPGVEKVKQIEIDQRVTELSEQYFPYLCESNGDSRAELSFIDGIKWMADVEPGGVDVIIVDSTDPIGPAEGLFSESFYRDCHKALGADGVLVQQSESPLYHQSLISDMRNAMQSAGFEQCKTLNFPQCVYPSGWWSATLAMKQRNSDGIRVEDARRKGFETQYYTADVHQAALAMPAFMEKLFS